ncbi:hypothetical protein Pelo_6479 [Pelomyxa schiedti]|nr:hypothetical protein Pelo_6479 [Pelomyxa schiedti]
MDALAVNKSLYHLDLSYTFLGNRELSLIFQKLRSTSLGSLDLSNNLIDDKGVGSICETLTTNPTLFHLDLTCNIITLSGARQLADALKSNTVLVDLKLRNNNIGVEGEQLIENAIHHNQAVYNKVLSHYFIRNECQGECRMYFASAVWDCVLEPGAQSHFPCVIDALQRHSLHWHFSCIDELVYSGLPSPTVPPQAPSLSTTVNTGKLLLRTDSGNASGAFLKSTSMIMRRKTPETLRTPSPTPPSSPRPRTPAMHSPWPPPLFDTPSTIQHLLTNASQTAAIILLQCVGVLYVRSMQPWEANDLVLSIMNSSAAPTESGIRGPLDALVLIKLLLREWVRASNWVVLKTVLQALSQVITHLDLSYLHLSDTYIPSDVWEALVCTSALQILDLKGNEFTTLPPSLQTISNVEFADNPLVIFKPNFGVPVEAASAQHSASNKEAPTERKLDWPTLREYLRQGWSAGVNLVQWLRRRVVVVGDTGVGKTTLLKCLKKKKTKVKVDKKVKKEKTPKSPGSTLFLDASSKSFKMRKKTKLKWDSWILKGDETNATSLQFFLGSRCALWLVVWDAGLVWQQRSKISAVTLDAMTTPKQSAPVNMADIPAVQRVVYWVKQIVSTRKSIDSCTSEKTITGTTVYCDGGCLCDSSSFLGGRGERILLIGTHTDQISPSEAKTVLQEVMEEVAFHINILSKESTQNKPTQQQISSAALTHTPPSIGEAIASMATTPKPKTKNSASQYLFPRAFTISCKTGEGFSYGLSESHPQLEKKVVKSIVHLIDDHCSIGSITGVGGVWIPESWVKLHEYIANVQQKISPTGDDLSVTWDRFNSLCTDFSVGVESVAHDATVTPPTKNRLLHTNLLTRTQSIATLGKTSTRPIAQSTQQQQVASERAVYMCADFLSYTGDILFFRNAPTTSSNSCTSMTLPIENVVILNPMWLMKMLRCIVSAPHTPSSSHTCVAVGAVGVPNAVDFFAMCGQLPSLEYKRMLHTLANLGVMYVKEQKPSRNGEMTSVYNSVFIPQDMQPHPTVTGLAGSLPDWCAFSLVGGGSSSVNRRSYTIAARVFEFSAIPLGLLSRLLTHILSMENMELTSVWKTGALVSHVTESQEPSSSRIPFLLTLSERSSTITLQICFPQCKIITTSGSVSTLFACRGSILFNTLIRTIAQWVDVCYPSLSLTLMQHYPCPHCIYINHRAHCKRCNPSAVADSHTPIPDTTTGKWFKPNELFSAVEIDGTVLQCGWQPDPAFIPLHSVAPDLVLSHITFIDPSEIHFERPATVQSSLTGTASKPTEPSGSVSHGTWKGNSVVVKELCLPTPSPEMEEVMTLMDTSAPLHDTTEFSVSEFLRQARVMQALPPHPNIVRVLGVCYRHPKTRVVMEYSPTPFKEKQRVPNSHPHHLAQSPSANNAKKIRKEQLAKFFRETGGVSKSDLATLIQLIMKYSSSPTTSSMWDCYDLLELVLPMSLRKHILHDVASAIHHLHSQSPPFVHTSLHPGNVFVCSREDEVPGPWAKISDYGLSQFRQSKDTHSPAVSEPSLLLQPQAYKSPEVFKDTPQNTESNIWNFGMIARLLLDPFTPPFSLSDRRDRDSAVQETSAESPVSLADLKSALISGNAYLAPLKCPQWGQHLVDWCCNKYPEKRPNSAQLLDWLDCILFPLPPLAITMETPCVDAIAPGSNNRISAMVWVSQELWCGLEDGFIAVYAHHQPHHRVDSHETQLLQKWQAHSCAVSCLLWLPWEANEGDLSSEETSISPGGFVLSVSVDGEMKVWDHLLGNVSDPSAPSSVPPLDIKQHTFTKEAQVTCLTALQGGRSLWSGDSLGGVCVWNITVCALSLQDNFNAVAALQEHLRSNPSPTSSQIPTGITAMTSLRVTEPHTQLTSCQCVSDCVLICFNAGPLAVFRAASHEILQLLHPPSFTTHPLSPWQESPDAQRNPVMLSVTATALPVSSVPTHHKTKRHSRSTVTANPQASVWVGMSGGVVVCWDVHFDCGADCESRDDVVPLFLPQDRFMIQTANNGNITSVISCCTGSTEVDLSPATLPAHPTTSSQSPCLGASPSPPLPPPPNPPSPSPSPPPPPPPLLPTASHLSEAVVPGDEDAGSSPPHHHSSSSKAKRRQTKTLKPRSNSTHASNSSHSSHSHRSRSSSPHSRHSSHAAHRPGSNKQKANPHRHHHIVVTASRDGFLTLWDALSHTHLCITHITPPEFHSKTGTTPTAQSLSSAVVSSQTTTTTTTTTTQTPASRHASSSSSSSSTGNFGDHHSTAATNSASSTVSPHPGTSHNDECIVVSARPAAAGDVCGTRCLVAASYRGSLKFWCL